MASTKSKAAPPADPTEAAPAFSSMPLWKDSAAAGVIPEQALGLAAHVSAVSDGVALILEILNKDAIELECEAPAPVFGDYDRGRLARLAWASCNMLHRTAEWFVRDAEGRANHA